MTISEIIKDLTNDYIDSELLKSKQHIITFVYPNKSDVTILFQKLQEDIEFKQIIWKLLYL